MEYDCIVCFLDPGLRRDDNAKRPLVLLKYDFSGACCYAAYSVNLFAVFCELFCNRIGKIASDGDMNSLKNNTLYRDHFASMTIRNPTSQA